MKALKIKRCSDPMFWYQDLVGAIAPLLGESADEFISREPAGYSNIVRKTDCDIVDVEEGVTFYICDKAQHEIYKAG